MPRVSEFVLLFQLNYRSVQMCILSPLQVKTLDETLQLVNHQSVCLKADLTELQQERDSLRHDVAVLKKQLQNVNDKVRKMQQEHEKAAFFGLCKCCYMLTHHRRLCSCVQ